jgi:hypothetical protein
MLANADEEDEPPTEALERWSASVTWRKIAVPPLAPSGSVILAVAPGEKWCARCGCDGSMPESDASNRSVRKAAATCIRCGSTRLVPATAVLRADEYYVAG